MPEKFLCGIADEQMRVLQLDLVRGIANSHSNSGLEDAAHEPSSVAAVISDLERLKNCMALTRH